MVNISDKEYQKLQSRLKELEAVDAEHKREDEALQKSEAKLKEAQELGRIGNWEYEVASQKLTWSNEVFVLYERDPSLGSPTIKEEAGYYSPAQAQILHDHAARAIETGKEFKYDLQANLPGGKTAYFYATMRPVKDKNGQVFKLFGTVLDITERKQMENNIKSSEARYRSLFDSSSDVLVQIDTTGTIVDLNKYAEAISGYKKGEIVGKKISALAGKFTVQSLAMMVANFAKRKLGFQVEAYEVESIGSAGQRLFFEINAVPLKDNAGKETGELAILHDITKRKQGMDELANKVKELEKLTKIMDGREDMIIELKKKIKELEAKQK